ncbi:cystathionine beta-lyase [Aquabacter sp. CN5-332]|uniref:cystathionine beta-lyase n=1 Tax=Aquabacter sp. CN5-332 TaxID=3156608 RepID=UPI0032B39E50
MKSPSPEASFAPATEVVRLGRDPFRFDGFVNPPVVRGSTVLSPTYEDLVGHTGRYSYGRRGNPTSEALEGALSALEGADGTVLTPSGLSAVSTALLSVLKAGDHLLMVDTAYRPTRRICDTVLSRLGIEVTYYDPLVGAQIAGLLKENTKAIFLESPGSQSFEMQDVPAIARVARERGITTLIDNTWATPIYFKPLDHGIDISIMAGTKYLSGHADLNIGTIAARGPAWKKVLETHGDLGLCVSPDDAALGARGLRTLVVRLERHWRSGLAVAQWLRNQPQVSRVLHPAMDGDPGYDIWRRDFSGACGLFGAILKPVPERAVAAFFDSLALFGMGYSWGGFESLIIPFDCTDYRTATTWNVEGPAIRLHVGLEEPEDLIADLARGFERMGAAA